MGYLEAIVLGLVQGLAEFLPISSSGHLGLLEYFFGIESEKVLFFAVILHWGTLLSVFIVYWKDIKELVVELFLLIKDIFTGKGLRIEERPVRKLGIMIIVATIPTAIIGFTLQDYFAKLFSSILAIGIGWIITGFLMLLAEKVAHTNKLIDKMNYRNAIFIGLLQGFAICPGVSRSGSTLVGGLISGLKREFAVKFAFLISIPSILGSAVLELPPAIKAGIEPSIIGPTIVGFLVAALAGLFAIKAMIKLVSAHKLKYFIYYVWAIGVLTISYSLFIA